MENFIGIILPFFIDFINKNIANSQAKFGIALVSSIVVAGIFNLGNLSSIELLGSAAIIFTEAQIVYKLYWEKSAPRIKLLGK